MKLQLKEIRPLIMSNPSKDCHLFVSAILSSFPNAMTEKDPNIIFTIGGDGTVLSALKNSMKADIPILGIANGTRNFIPSKIDNPEEFFSLLKEGIIDLHIEKTFSLAIKVKQANGDIIKAEALNDVVFGAGIMDFNHFVVYNSEDESILNLSAMGVCISTPLGSTAFHRNNFGPITHELNFPIMSLTSVVSDLDKRINKSVGADEVICISLDEEKESRADVIIFVDGYKKQISLNMGDVVEITRGSDVRLCFKDAVEFKRKRLTY